MSSQPTCHKCGCTLHGCPTYFIRANEKGMPAIWECANKCNAPKIPFDVALLAAIEYEEMK